MQITNREQALSVINDLYGMDRDMLNNTIGNGSVNPLCYTDDQIIRFAECQIEWNNSDLVDEVQLNGVN